MFSLNGKRFRLAKIGLVRAGCPREMQLSAANRAAANAIVIVANKRGMGRVDSTGYVPQSIVAAGARRRGRLLDSGIALSWAYVQDGAVEIKADHEIGCQELMSKLGNLITEKMIGSSAAALANTLQGQPWIMEVYPFENYCIFQYKGQKYRQGFALDPIERIVGLSGEPVKVDEKFVNATAFIERNQDGSRYAFAPPDSATSFSTGGKDSELVTQIFRNWKNITEAVEMYLSYLHAEQSVQPVTDVRQINRMRPAFAPVSLSDDGKILAQLAARGPGVYDFATWSAGEQEDTSGTKSHGGDRVPMSQHAFVGDPNDKSTWKLPLDTPGRAKNALARVNQTDGIPTNKKAAVLHKVQKAAKKHGVDVSKPSSGQKQWVGRKVAATWSDEAREAAKAARQAGAGLARGITKVGTALTPGMGDAMKSGNDNLHGVMQQHGWAPTKTATTDSKMTTHYKTPALPDHRASVTDWKSGGQTFSHTAPDQEAGTHTSMSHLPSVHNFLTGLTHAATVMSPQ